MHSPNSPNFSRPLLPPPPSSTSIAPPPLSYLSGHNLPISILELSEETILRASVDGNFDNIHYPANEIPEPYPSTEKAQKCHHKTTSPSPTFLSHHPRITMPSQQLPHLATSPNLATPLTVPPIIEPQQSAPNRDGAISRIDQYSRVLPPIPTHLSTLPPLLLPPIPAIHSSSSSSILFNPSRPSNLRHITFAHETSNPSLISQNSSENSSHLSSSFPTRPPGKQRFNLSLARQGMHKALSSLRTHTHTLYPKPNLLLRKKYSHSALSESSSLSDSGDELARPRTAPSSSSSSLAPQFTFASPFPSPISTKNSKDVKNANPKKEMQISAPTGMIKKAPEEIQQMLREMGVKSGDLPFVLGSSSGLPVSSFDGDNQSSPSGTLKNLTTHPQEKDTSPSLLTTNPSATRKGKRTDHTPSPQYPKTHTFTRPTRSSSLSSPHAGPVQNLTTKPPGWYSRASLSEIRATLPKVRKEDLLSNEEIPEFLEGLLKDFEVIKWVRDWRDGAEEWELKREIEKLRREGCNREDEGDDDDIEGEEEPYTWPHHNPPDPNFVDGGWAQDEVSRAGIGKRWFVFDDVESVLGEMKCPIRYAVDGNLDEGDGDGGSDFNTMFLSLIEEGLGEVEGNEKGEDEFDEDAHKTFKEEVLRREGSL